MTNEEFEKILEQNKNNNLVICYEYFNFTNKISFNDFVRAFPEWIVVIAPIIYIKSEGKIELVIEKATKQIVEHLKIKHNIKN